MTEQVKQMGTRQHTILVVDDNVTVRKLLEDRLNSRGYQVVLASDGYEALDIMRQKTVHLVLLDIMMPDMDGYEVLAQMQADPELRRIHVVVMSALHEMDSIVKCIKLGAEDYLFKPFNSALFWARINASLEKRRLQDQERAYFEELNTLQQIDLQLNSTLDLQEVARVILHWSVQQTNAVIGVVGTFTKDAFEVWAKFGPPDVALGDLSTYRVYLNFVQERQYLQPIHLSPETVLLPDVLHRMYVPIRREGTILGYIILDGRHYFTDESQNFLSRLSNHAAIAINNAQLHAKVKEANRAKSDFVAFVAHELKSPLSSLMIYAGLMDSLGQTALLTKRHAYSQSIVSTINRMNALISELTDITRIETGQWDLKLTAVSISDVVEEVLASFAEKIAQKEQEIQVDVPASLPLVWADHRRVVQVMTNLCSNAWKYTPTGGQIKIKARKRKQKRTAFVEISVADDGIGIEERDQDKIFSRFFRADNEHVNEERGAGLGLHITKQIIEEQKGQIWFNSEPGRGTTFYFTLPTADSQMMPREKQQVKESL